MNPNTRRKRRIRRNERQHTLRLLGTLEPDLGDAPPCDPRIHEKGRVVFITHTIRTAHMEAWIRRVAKLSGQPVDWHQAGGRPHVKTLGDVAKVRKALLTLRNEHDDGYYFASGPERGKAGRAHRRRIVSGIWSFNGFALYPGSLPRRESMTAPRAVLALWAFVTAVLVATGSGFEVLWLALALAPLGAAEAYKFYIYR